MAQEGKRQTKTPVTVKLFGLECAVPITDGALYRDAYHGTSEDRASDIEKYGFRPGKEGWYGEGIYFWLHDLEAAVWWAKCHMGFALWAVVQSLVDCRRTLNADVLVSNDEVKAAIRDARWTDLPDRAWTSAHIKSKIAWLFLKACDDEGIDIDSVLYLASIKDLNRNVHAIVLKESSGVRKSRKVERTEISSPLARDGS